MFALIFFDKLSYLHFKHNSTSKNHVTIHFEGDQIVNGSLSVTFHHFSFQNGFQSFQNLAQIHTNLTQLKMRMKYIKQTVFQELSKPQNQPQLAHFL